MENERKRFGSATTANVISLIALIVAAASAYYAYQAYSFSRSTMLVDKWLELAMLAHNNLVLAEFVVGDMRNLIFDAEGLLTADNAVALQTLHEKTKGLRDRIKLLSDATENVSDDDAHVLAKKKLNLSKYNSELIQITQIINRYRELVQRQARLLDEKQNEGAQNPR